MILNTTYTATYLAIHYYFYCNIYSNIFFYIYNFNYNILLTITNCKQLSLGKYHFRIYVASCATSWYIHKFKIHSRASHDVEMADELRVVESDAESDDGMTGQSGVAPIAPQPSVVRQHVLDLTSQWTGKATSPTLYLYAFLNDVL
jgi:hypothetical protein